MDYSCAWGNDCRDARTVAGCNDRTKVAAIDWVCLSLKYCPWAAPKALGHIHLGIRVSPPENDPYRGGTEPERPGSHRVPSSSD